MRLQHLAGLELGRADLAAQLSLDRGVEADLRERAQEFPFLLAHPGDELGGTRQALGNLILLAADVAQGFVERAQGFGSGKAHLTTVSRPRRARRRGSSVRGSRIP